MGYWKNWSNVKSELEKIIDEIGHFPSQEELSMINGSLPSIISRYHGGLYKIKRKFGYKDLNKPAGYWEDWGNVERELKEVISKIEHFPSSNELRQMGYSGLNRAISRNHNGLDFVRKKLGYKSRESKPQGYWKDFKKIEIILRRIIEEIGHFPSRSELNEMNFSSLGNAISSYHGSINEVRMRMGYEEGRKPKDYWTKWSNIKEKLELIIKNIGHFPSSTELEMLCENRLLQGMIKHHGGLSKVRKKLGYKETRKPRSYWSNWDNIEKEFNVIVKRLKHFPTPAELLNLGNYSGLVDSIQSYHGGFSEVRTKLGYELIKRPHNYWKDWNNVKQELEKVIQEIGHFPTNKELEITGNSSLSQAITKYHGGFVSIKERMGYGVSPIRDKEQFIEFLRTDNVAASLSAAAINLNGFRYDIEQILTQIYEGKFENQDSLHSLIDHSTEEIYGLIQEGITNLGYFIGSFSLGDKRIIPILLGEAIAKIPNDKVTGTLEERLIRLMRSNYSPQFNDDPDSVVSELRERVESSKGPKRKLYKTLFSHYSEVLKLQEELN